MILVRRFWWNAEKGKETKGNGGVTLIKRRASMNESETYVTDKIERIESIVASVCFAVC